MQSAQIIKINDDGGLLPKKKSTEQGVTKEEIVTHTKFFFDEGLRRGTTSEERGEGKDEVENDTVVLGDMKIQ